MVSSLAKSIRAFTNNTSFRLLTINAISAVVPILTTIVVARDLPPSEIGFFALFQSLALVLYPILGMSNSGLILNYFLVKKEIELPPVIGASFLVPVLFGTLLFVFSLVFFGLGSEYFSNVLFLIVHVVFYTFVQSSWTFFQGKENFGHYAFSKIGYSMISFISSLFFVKVLGEGWLGLIKSVTLAAVIVGTYFFIYLIQLKSIKLIGLRKSCLELCSYGSSLLPHTIGTIVIFNSDRWFLFKLLGPSETGIYSIAAQFASGINLISASLNQAFLLKWSPVLIAGDSLERKAIVRSGISIFKLLIGMAIFSMAVSYFIFPLFFSSSYHGLQPSFCALVIANVLLGVYQVVSCPIFINRKNRALSTATFFITILHIVILYLLTKRLGLVGALATCLFTNAFLAIVAFNIAQSITWLPWLGSGSRRNNL